MLLGFQSGNILICEDISMPSSFTVLNWSQFNIDFKMKPISAIDMIEVGSRFTMIGDQSGQLVILNHKEIAFSEQLENEIVAAKWVCALKFVVVTKDA